MAPSLDKNKNNSTRPCGYHTLVGRVIENGIPLIIIERLHCNRWSCKYCGPRKAKLYAWLIGKAAKKHNLDRFLTLTLGRRDLKGAEGIRYIRRAWKKLRRKLSRKYGKPISYILVAELHKDGVPHVHVLLDRFIKQSWIKGNWVRFGGGPIVHIERVKDIEKMGAYLGKYMASGFLSLPKGVRRFSTSRDIKLREREPEGEWMVLDYDIDRVLGTYKDKAFNVVTDESGEVESFSMINDVDLNEWYDPNDWPEMNLLEAEWPDEFDRDDWALIKYRDGRDEELGNGGDLHQGIEQGTGRGRILAGSPEETSFGICAEEEDEGAKGIRGRANGEEGRTARIQRNGEIPAKKQELQKRTG